MSTSAYLVVWNKSGPNDPLRRHSASVKKERSSREGYPPTPWSPFSNGDNKPTRFQNKGASSALLAIIFHAQHPAHRRRRRLSGVNF